MTVVDVKVAYRAAAVSVAALFAWTGERMRWRGWGFEVWSGADACVLANVRFLAGYRRRAVVAQELIPIVLAAAREQGSMAAMERALGGQCPPTLVRPVVLHLLWTGRLRADLTRPLSAGTPLCLGEAVGE